jgi:hypothetical protein
MDRVAVYFGATVPSLTQVTAGEVKVLDAHAPVASSRPPTKLRRLRKRHFRFAPKADVRS